MTSRITSDMLRLSPVAAAGSGALRGEGVVATHVSAGALPTEPSHVEFPVGLQTADDLHIPEKYEARYAYPLIVWLTSADAPGRCFRPLMRRISDRNCFGAAVRVRSGMPLEDHVYETVVGLRRKYHIHSERIYLAGIGKEAVAALRTGLARPEWFGGIVALSAELPTQQRWLGRFEALQGKRVFLGAGRDDALQVETTQRLQRLLWSAGMAVRAVSYEFRDNIDDGLYREIDRWMIQAIEEAAAA